jgi:acylphosphatase
MLVARRYVIAGRVTGVGFRYFVYETAEREGVGGWARNLYDRRVEVLAEGDADALMRFELALRRGPPGARVDDVETEVLAPPGRFPGFSIRG